MGLTLDWSALAPGPSGTAMIGEGGIDTAARRGQARRKREKDLKKPAGSASSNAGSQISLNPPSTHENSDDANKRSFNTDHSFDLASEDRHFETRNMVQESETTEDTVGPASDVRKSDKGGMRARWRRFRGLLP